MAELKTLFGAMVRRHRKLRGWSQIALAEAVGRSLETVARIERGQSGASFEVVEELANALDVRPSALFGVDTAGDAKGDFEDLVIQLAQLEPDRLAWIRGVLEAALAKER